jgi:hypothetical protein
MQILDWLETKGVSLGTLAEKWGRPKSNLSLIFRGKRFPTFPDIVRSHVETKGKVKVDDWIVLNRPQLEAEGVISKEWKPSG